MIPDEIQRDKPTVPISSITIRDDLYPRLQKNPALVQRYAENIEVLPPIEINQHNELIDGWHRLMAYKTANLTEIPVTVTETKSDVETLALAIERNAKHGLQLNSADKREMAIRLYNNGEGWSKKEIARILSVGESTVYRYLEGISTRCDEEIDKIILEMHRAGATQQEIADATGIPQRTISDRLQRLVVSLTRENPLNPESSPEPQPEPETTQEEEPAFEEDPDAYIPPEEVPPPEEPAEKPVPTSTFNQTNDNIEWARWSWNPVTGCRYNCPYCYARDIANRFYQEKFEPTFRPERLSAPQNTKVPAGAETNPGLRNVFVCSMADLFGDWVPDEWIEAVLDAVRAAPQWNFLFLTKNPKRLPAWEWPDNAWVGTTVDCQVRVKAAEEAFAKVTAPVKFISCEPLREPLKFEHLNLFDWIIIGGQSRSSGQPEAQPEWPWVEDLLSQARKSGIPVYFKPNLTVRPREYPRGV
jgi:protein gp37/DNA-directed RNA polymerase specialized sigma24 family protein